MMQKIWVVTDNFDWEGIQSIVGYFLTQEDAQAYIDAHNTHGPHYLDYEEVESLPVEIITPKDEDGKL